MIAGFIKVAGSSDLVSVVFAISPALSLLELSLVAVGLLMIAFALLRSPVWRRQAAGGIVAAVGSVAMFETGAASYLWLNPPSKLAVDSLAPPADSGRRKPEQPGRTADTNSAPLPSAVEIAREFKRNRQLPEACRAYAEALAQAGIGGKLALEAQRLYDRADFEEAIAKYETALAQHTQGGTR